MSEWFKLMYVANGAQQYTGVFNDLIHYAVLDSDNGSLLYYSTRRENGLEGEQFSESEW